MKIQTTSPLLQNPVNTSGTLEASVTALNQTLELNPENVIARQDLYETMQQLLRKDAFLAYQGETDAIYKVSTPTAFEFIHPKDRAMPDLFPPLTPPPARPATYWLGWSIVGLIPAGVGTLVFAPLAVIAAVILLGRQTVLMDRRRAWIVISAAIALWLIALVFFFILILHLE